MKQPTITVITSVPPVIPSRPIDGNDVGKAYRQACIDSWQCFGGRIISVNNNKEADAVRAATSGISICPVASDGTAVAKRPLVLFDDLLHCAAQEETELIALTNSDIFLADAEMLREQAVCLKSGEVLVSRRVNVESLRNASGSTYKWGYDLFILRREDIARLHRETTLFFGEPWWDYYFLSNLILSGLSVVTTDSAHVLHLAHKEAYSSERWLATGEFSLQTLRQLAETGAYAAYPTVRHFIRYVINTSSLLPVKDVLLLAMRNFRALTLYHVMLCYKFCPQRKSPQENDLHFFSCALTAYAELIINFGVSSRARINKACSELHEKMQLAVKS